MNKISYFLLFFLFIPAFVYGNNTPQRLKQVSVQFPWKNQFEYAGFYIAKEKGYYKDIGLDVIFKEWEHGINITDEVKNSKTEYGVISSSILIDISQGNDFVLLAALYQSNPLVILGNKASGISSVKQFKNKRVMLNEAHTSDASLVAMLSAAGLKIEDLQIVKHSFNPASLLNGEADLMAAYISNEPFKLKELGGDPVVFSSQGCGFDFYNDIIITNRDYLQDNPEEIRDFTAATLKGFAYAFSHIKETVDIVYYRYNSLKKSPKALLYEAQELKKFLYYKKNKLGELRAENLAKIYDVYKLLGKVKPGMEINKIIYKYHQNETQLSEEEKAYFSPQKELTVCISPEWPSPFHFIDEKGKRHGIVIDYLDILKNKIDIRFSMLKTSSWNETLDLIKKERCDIVPLAIKTKSKQGLLSFTDPYLDFPIVITTRNDVSFVDGAADIGDKPVVMLKDHYLQYFLKEKSYNFNAQQVENSEEALQKVHSGEVFAFIDSLPSMVYALQMSQYNKNLKISGKLTKDLHIQIGTKSQDKKLSTIVNKVFNNMDLKEKQKISNKWFPVEFAEKTNYVLIIKFTILFVSILIALLFWIRKITRNNRLLQRAEQEIKYKNVMLEKAASIDTLTQLYNRSKIDKLLQHEIDYNRTNNQKFGICLLDIDFFKKINDTHGHQVGDNVLVGLAQALVAHTRASDAIGRWGGEEFLIIFPQITEENLEALAEKLRIQIKELSFGQCGHITISLGITMYQETDTVFSLIQRADEALYKAKRNGRDCVVKS